MIVVKCMLQAQCKQSSCIEMMLMFLAVHRKHRVVHLQIPFVVESVIRSSALTRGLSITTLVRTSWALLPGVNHLVCSAQSVGMEGICTLTGKVGSSVRVKVGSVA